MLKHPSAEHLGMYRSSSYYSDDGCLNRIPYFSAIGFFMCFVGVVLFSSMMWFAVNASVEQFRRALDLTDLPWLDKINLAFLIIAFVMALFAIFLLAIAIVSTGRTREQIYKRESARRGGECFGITAMACSYILNILWMFVFATTAILSAGYYVLSRLCSSLAAYNESNCLDFSVFQPLFKDTPKETLNLCGGNAQQFCAATNSVVAWYFIGFLGSLIVCLGLVQFLASSTANHSRVKNEKRYNELHNAVFGDSIPEFTPYLPNNYYPPPPIHGTLPSYHGTQPRSKPNFVPPSPLRQNGTLPYNSYSRRNSYHNSMGEWARDY
ncbi:unnamed protein product [Bursaphelenchus okinawaensis]|uniref:Uncharacterized protein n=1 Tax=Bursaphelenchus okinawaensis TaxID=465554 RepID=A0A811K4X2_9BILA|nr:unnamed protein product [Bursaphelenchus okinawaensis]CAG9091414.1 unnamed protein product [Bursaphelenchus okinawaensis]